MTEDQARTKWCPFARVPDSNGTSGLTATNRHAGKKKRSDGKISVLRSSAMCIASECMAWRSVAVASGWCGLASQNEPWEPPGSL